MRDLAVVDASFAVTVITSHHTCNWCSALTADLFYAKQRDFDQRFSLQEYDTVTGFLSYYRDLPFYDMRLKINAGKFLGKDVGMLIDISRRFDTGARVGGIVALTDCDSQCVGEGSFNKWIYFELPMEMFYVERTTRHKAGYTWSPLTKDAGSKLGTGSLYDVLVNAMIRSINNRVDGSPRKVTNRNGIFTTHGKYF